MKSMKMATRNDKQKGDPVRSPKVLGFYFLSFLTTDAEIHIADIIAKAATI